MENREYRGEPNESQLVEAILNQPEFKQRVDAINQLRAPDEHRAELLRKELLEDVESIAVVYQDAEKKD